MAVSHINVTFSCCQWCDHLLVSGTGVLSLNHTNQKQHHSIYLRCSFRDKVTLSALSKATLIRLFCGPWAKRNKGRVRQSVLEEQRDDLTLSSADRKESKEQRMCWEDKGWCSGFDQPPWEHHPLIGLMSPPAHGANRWSECSFSMVTRVTLTRVKWASTRQWRKGTYYIQSRETKPQLSPLPATKFHGIWFCIFSHAVDSQVFPFSLCRLVFPAHLSSGLSYCWKNISLSEAQGEFIF